MEGERKDFAFLPTLDVEFGSQMWRVVGTAAAKVAWLSFCSYGKTSHGSKQSNLDCERILFFYLKKPNLDLRA